MRLHQCPRSVEKFEQVRSNQFNTEQTNHQHDILHDTLITVLVSKKIKNKTAELCRLFLWLVKPYAANINTARFSCIGRTDKLTLNEAIAGEGKIWQQELDQWLRCKFPTVSSWLPFSELFFPFLSLISIHRWHTSWVSQLLLALGASKQLTSWWNRVEKQGPCKRRCISACNDWNQPEPCKCISNIK
jgi:hypothetical protein